MDDEPFLDSEPWIPFPHPQTAVNTITAANIRRNALFPNREALSIRILLSLNAE
jgi:hypothetical protein